MKYLLFILLLGGCEGTLTEVVVQVDTDMNLPEELDEIRIDIVEPNGNTQRAWADLRADGRASLPRSLGLVHRGGALGPVQVEATGRVDNEDLIIRRQRFHFIEGQTLVLQMDLLRACLDVVCSESETCGPAGCRPVDIDPEELIPFRQDGGPNLGDGQIAEDAATDAGEMDGGVPDAGATDAGSTSDATTSVDAGANSCVAPCVGTCNLSCTAAEPCYCGAGCDCQTTCLTRDCGIVCTGAGATCSSNSTGTDLATHNCEEGADCDFEVAQGSNATFDCSGGSTCSAECEQTDDCTLRCREASSCRLECSLVNNCEITQCDGTLVNCPDGTLRCNISC